MAAASIAHLSLKNLILIAYAGSFGESIGFYSTVFIQHILITDKKCKAKGKKFSYTDMLSILSGIFIEFGPGGIIDGVLLRPFFMYVFPVLLNNFTLGILVGKIAGDITFYMLVIASYEIIKQRDAKKFPVKQKK